MLPKQFTDIKYRFDKFKRLNLLFENKQEKYSLYFDGFDFTFNPVLTTKIDEYFDLNNSINKEGDYIQINSIKLRDDEMTFILFSDGTIFQIYFMMDDEASPQRLSEFGRHSDNANSMTPLGITQYEAAYKRYDSGVECKIRIDET